MQHTDNAFLSDAIIIDNQLAIMCMNRAGPSAYLNVWRHENGLQMESICRF